MNEQEIRLEFTRIVLADAASMCVAESALALSLVDAYLNGVTWA